MPTTEGKHYIDRAWRLLFQTGLLIILLFSLGNGSQAKAQYDIPPVDGTDLVSTDQVIIKFKEAFVREKSVDPESLSQVQALSDAAGVELTYVRGMSANTFVYRLPSRMMTVDLNVILQNLNKLTSVEYAEPDIIMQHDATPNDPYFVNQWDYAAPASNYFGINAAAAWDFTTGASSVVVAVVDTGITNHVEFTGRTVPGYDFITDISTANDGNGRDSDPSDPGDWVAKNECYPGSSSSNSSWHGTHTAGTIGAAGNNGIGVAGINWQSMILPVRVLGKCGGYMSDIIDGMKWAAGLPVTGVPANIHPAKVINLSLSGTGTCSTTLQTAINSIVTAGTTIVVSAGNNNADASGFTPANCNDVITVAATSRSGNRASYSNYGSSVEISAPGGDGSNYTDWVLSTYNTGTTSPSTDAYAWMAGTSMSAPHVTGVVSLLYSLKQQLSPSQILYYLQSTATAFPGGSTCSTSTCGSGIVNAGAAVNAIYPTSVDLISFTATGKSKAILLTWETVNEIDHLGFNLYRARSLDGEKIKLNDGLIQTAYPGSPIGSEYTYKDKTTKPGKAYYYWLETMDIYDRTELFGPVKAKIIVQ